MWFSVAYTLIDNGTCHHSGQNAVVRKKFSYITERALCFSYVIIVIGREKSRHCQTSLECRFSLNENLQGINLLVTRKNRLLHRKCFVRILFTSRKTLETS